jgi:hypothetical protein
MIHILTPMPPRRQKKGIKFKLVKSNSCSSRLELAGTDLGGARNMVENEIKNLVNGQREHFDEEEAEDGEEEKENERKEARKHKLDGKSKADLEQEETVKDMIYKLETKKYSQAAAAPAKPRIIESRCIEKVHPTLKLSSPTTTTTRVMNEKQESEKIKLPFVHEKSPIEPLIEQTNDCEEYVTINNHISIANKHPEQNNNATTMMNEHIEGENGNGKVAALMKPKIVRNKNVDLALLAAVSKKKEVGKVHRGLKRDDSEHKFAPNDCKNEHENTFIKTSHNNEMNNIFNIQSAQQQHQDKVNSLHFSKSFHFENDEHFAVIKAHPLQSSMATNRAEDKPVKMVNWGTVGTYCKEYIANDNRIVHQQIKTLEEMEFEEFEVAGEHYDSLNSK